MITAIRFLQHEDILVIHDAGLQTYGGLQGIRDKNALLSAASAPEQAHAYGDDDLFSLAARYSFYLAESQSFVDGNKRTALGAALVFLDANHCDWQQAKDDLADPIIGLSDGSVTIAALAERFRAMCAH
jgi:death-on-curing protein